MQQEEIKSKCKFFLFSSLAFLVIAKRVVMDIVASILMNQNRKVFSMRI
jgi:hypothetical protein